MPSPAPAVLATLLLIAAAVTAAVPANAGPDVVTTAASAAASAAALRARYQALRTRLEHNTYQQRFYVESVESSEALQGDVYAQVDYAFATAAGALTSPSGWCDALILHLNVKYCRPYARATQSFLSVAVGTKFDQELDEAFRVEFAFTVTASAPDYLQVDLAADRGPLGTTNYRIALQAVALDGGRMFLHMRYSYRYGFEGRLAMKTYLSTTGRGKVGFTTVTDESGAPHFIGGVRGTVERNAMRYYLAIDAYLGTLATPAPQRIQASFERWFAATERYARQLHEVDRNTYLGMKQREYRRQQTSQ